MTRSREEVLELLSAKRITTDEAEQLLIAIDAGKRGASTWVLDPLSHLSTATALALTIVPIVAQLLIDRAGNHFDGVLDLHTNGHPNPWNRVALDALVGFPLVTIVLWAAARIVKRGSRLIDVAAAAGLSRWPLSAQGLLLLPLASQSTEGLNHRTGPARILIACSVPLVAWSVAILCLGFRTATGLTGSRLAWTFVGGLAVAELLSKLVLILPILGH